MNRNLKLPLDVLQGEPRFLSQEELRMSNFTVAKELSDFFSSILGPKSLQKMIVEQDSFAYIITSDGKTVLQRFDLAQFKAKHPVAVLFRELSKTQDYDLGDGTTSAIILAGELLDKAGKLISSGVHPNIVAEGYKMAYEKCIQICDELSHPVDDEILLKVAETAIDTKYTAFLKEKLARYVVDAIKRVSREGGRVDPDDVHIEKKGGEEVPSTVLYPGFIIEAKFVHPHMPKRMEDVKIALIDVPLTVKPREGLFSEISHYNVKIDDADDIKTHIEQEKKVLMGFFEKIKESGANVVISRKSIDRRLYSVFASQEMIAIQHLPTRWDLEKLRRAIGAKIVSDINSISPDDLGHAELIEEKKYPDRSTYVFIKTPDARTATIFLRGGAWHVISESARAVDDALHAVACAINDRILPGGGAIEIQMAQILKKYAYSEKTKRQLAILAFAEALESIPKILARNSGKDPILVLLDLRSRHSTGRTNDGFDANEKKIVDAMEKKIVDPLEMKKGIIKGAYETAQIILRSDDIIYGEVMQSRIEKEIKKK
ncbi:MAG: thermosome subunit alpha [Candidatus Syntropharchaeia archaeon]